ncbi:DUF917-domain-containing protein [Mycena sanguinolenta]|uniref:DUF917-domain-containing protein n=1 Tax=Mycena sanguinolenta TaxID=230812 RepID=A0A8H6Y9N0_9AGAR|nr:DUF917-domain-containing protein [Mycena sanguinolenta]
MPSVFRIGVDVGGTNTDGVLLDPSATSQANKGILAWHKSPTTLDPSHGIQTVITALLHASKIEARDVASVTIGTTHFINAVLEKDSNRLAPVAVLRLCGPFSRDVSPAIDWPADLRDIICRYCAFVDGGLEIDGEPIKEIDEGQVAQECRIIQEKNIKSIVVNGIFSPSDLVQRQEERVSEWVREYYPEADVVISKEVANLGFIERENAAILNASILPFARSTMRSFERAMRRLQLQCPLFITQNDGTILPARLAARLPIRTFSSGPTNSMCGAAFLVPDLKENMLVVDIGGTSTDVGMLLASGLPRQAAAVTEISGVRMNFFVSRCEEVQPIFIGLGGGSLVRKGSTSAKLIIGPDSVGHHIHTRALVFGGDVPTATDYAVVAQGLTNIGDATLVPVAVRDGLTEYTAVVTQMLERVIDSMKTSDADIPVLLVGGGAILAPDTLRGASRVVKPEYSGVANAIGAAIARVSGTIDIMVSTADRTTRAVLEDISRMAVDRAVENGAIRESVKIAEMDAIPLNASVPPLLRTLANALATRKQNPHFLTTTMQPSLRSLKKKPSERAVDGEASALDIAAYKPTVTAQREWLISEIDLEWISTGCYILGTGGGGTPYPHFVRLRQMLRTGSVVRVISPDDLSDTAVIACGGGKGSPTVSIEKLPADEQMEAQRMVYEQIGHGCRPDAVIALEIGGGNGLQGMLLGASSNLDVPTVDGDWMGRAYPVSWQITPVVLGGDKAHFLPTAIADGNGNNMLLLSGASEKLIERIFRAALSEMGSHVACAKGPCSGKNTKEWVIDNTISLAWRIGRAVALCRVKNQIDFVADAIIEQVGGRESAKVLFRGKIVSVERKTVKGHVYGEVVISASDVSELSGLLKIPFKNENIVALAVDGDGKEEVVASVPDLISVCDVSTGEAIGTPEYRYGLLVFVLGIQASEKWTATPRGIQIGGPRAFGMDADYKPLGIFRKPRSVIDEFAQR